MKYDYITDTEGMPSEVVRMVQIETFIDAVQILTTLQCTGVNLIVMTSSHRHTKPCLLYTSRCV